MAGFRLSPAGSEGSSPRARTPITVPALAALLAAALLIGWFLGVRRSSSNSLPPDLGPVVVAMRRIGQLHTASFTMKDVLTEESQKDPEGWMAGIPGATEIFHWATHNNALVVAQGTVEAGVDLSSVSSENIQRPAAREGPLVVQLPAATIYQPVVHLRVQSDHPGPFWRDENLVPKAQVEAERRFTEAAEQAGIRTQAEQNTAVVLQRMLAALGYAHTTFRFTGAARPVSAPASLE